MKSLKKRCYLIVLMVLISSILLIPTVVRADWTYTVRRGDTLFNIAKKTGLTVNSIKARNGLGNNSLRIGQRITIPTATSASTSSPAPTGGNSYLLASLIYAEAGAEPYVGMVAVGGVVLNRVQNSKFPKTIAGVIYQPQAFESVSNGIINRAPSSDAQKAARDALNGWDPSGGALYFFNPSKPVNPWIWARRIINRIGRHVFAI